MTIEGGSDNESNFEDGIFLSYIGHFNIIKNVIQNLSSLIPNINKSQIDSIDIKIKSIYKLLEHLTETAHYFRDDIIQRQFIDMIYDQNRYLYENLLIEREKMVKEYNKKKNLENDIAYLTHILDKFDDE